MPKPPRRLTFRQERFCLAYLRYNNATKAAIEAGYSERSARNQAYRMLQTQRIRARLMDMQADAVMYVCSGVDAMLMKLQAVYEQAIEAGHTYAAVRAVELQSRILGMGDRLRRLHVEPHPATVPPFHPSAGGAPRPSRDFDVVAVEPVRGRRDAW